MELSDSGDFHADYKGKVKLKILKTPIVNGTSIPLSDSDNSINNCASSQMDSHSTLPWWIADKSKSSSEKLKSSVSPLPFVT
jgi:hypothetical protein